MLIKDRLKFFSKTRSLEIAKTILIQTSKLSKLLTRRLISHLIRMHYILMIINRWSRWRIALWNRHYLSQKSPLRSLGVVPALNLTLSAKHGWWRSLRLSIVLMVQCRLVCIKNRSMLPQWRSSLWVKRMVQRQLLQRLQQWAMPLVLWEWSSQRHMRRQKKKTLPTPPTIKVFLWRTVRDNLLGRILYIQQKSRTHWILKPQYKSRLRLSQRRRHMQKSRWWKSHCHQHKGQKLLNKLQKQ